MVKNVVYWFELQPFVTNKDPSKPMNKSLLFPYTLIVAVFVFRSFGRLMWDIEFWYKMVQKSNSS